MFFTSLEKWLVFLTPFPLEAGVSLLTIVARSFTSFGEVSWFLLSLEAEVFTVTGSSVACRVGFAVQWLTCLTFDHSCYSPWVSYRTRDISV